jgi:hypothetical protein
MAETKVRYFKTYALAHRRKNATRLLLLHNTCQRIRGDVAILPEFMHVGTGGLKTPTAEIPSQGSRLR